MNPTTFLLPKTLNYSTYYYFFFCILSFASFGWFVSSVCMLVAGLVIAFMTCKMANCLNRIDKSGHNCFGNLIERGKNGKFFILFCFGAISLNKFFFLFVFFTFEWKILNRRRRKTTTTTMSTKKKEEKFELVNQKSAVWLLENWYNKNCCIWFFFSFACFSPTMAKEPSKRNSVYFFFFCS